MNISIVDYIGNINGGIAILLSWIIDDEYFEFVFWFNRKNDYKVYSEKNLTDKLQVVGDIHNWCQIENFIVYVNSIIPPKEEIFNEFKI